MHTTCKSVDLIVNNFLSCPASLPVYQDAVSRLLHEPHVALFSRVLEGEERLEAVQQWLQAQAMLTEACAQRQHRGNVSREV